MNDNKGQTIFLSVIGIATLLVAIVGATFAWFSATVTTTDGASNSVIITTATLGTVTFSNGAEINVNNIYPGWSDTKTVSVTSDSNATAAVPYVITLHIAANTFARQGGPTNQGYIQYTYTASGNDASNALTTARPITETSGAIDIISGTLPAASSVTHTYVITFTFPELSSDQNSQQGQTFSAWLDATTSTRYTNDGTPTSGRSTYTGA